MDQVLEVPGLCEGVWQSTYRACNEEFIHQCVGLGCLFNPCGLEADGDLAICCAQVATGAAYEECLESKD